MISLGVFVLLYWRGRPGGGGLEGVRHIVVLGCVRVSNPSDNLVTDKDNDTQFRGTKKIGRSRGRQTLGEGHVCLTGLGI